MIYSCPVILYGKRNGFMLVSVVSPSLEELNVSYSCSKDCNTIFYLNIRAPYLQLEEISGGSLKYLGAQPVEHLNYYLFTVGPDSVSICLRSRNGKSAPEVAGVLHSTSPVWPTIHCTLRYQRTYIIKESLLLKSPNDFRSAEQLSRRHKSKIAIKRSLFPRGQWGDGGISRNHQTRAFNLIHLNLTMVLAVE